MTEREKLSETIVHALLQRGVMVTPDLVEDLIAAIEAEGWISPERAEERTKTSFAKAIEMAEDAVTEWFFSTTDVTDLDTLTGVIEALKLPSEPHP